MHAKVIGGLLCVLTTPLLAANETRLPVSWPAWVVRNSVEPVVYRGPCPAALRFTGEIAKETWGDVDYHWVRSDGSRSPSAQIDFNAQGPHVKSVAMQWRVDPQPGQQVWAALEIKSPPGSQSNVGKAVAKVICTNRPVARQRGTGDNLSIDPCTEASDTGPTTAAVWQCAEKRRHDAEAELAQVVEDFLTRLTPLPTEKPDEAGLHQSERKRLEVFQTSQRLWSDYRVEACEEVYLEYWPGSSAKIHRTDCLTQLSKERTQYLRGRLAGDGNAGTGE